MATVLIVAYLMIVLALIAVILLQRSEGGALGIGGGTGGGLVSVRGSANLLTRTTAILAALFFATAIGLTILSELDRRSRGGIIDQATDSVGTEQSTTSNNILDSLNLNPTTTTSTDNSLALPQTTGAGAAAPAPAEAAVTTTAPATAAPAASAPAAAATSDPALAVPAGSAATTTTMVEAPAAAPAQPMSAPATTTAPAQ